MPCSAYLYSISFLRFPFSSHMNPITAGRNICHTQDKFVIWVLPELLKSVQKYPTSKGLAFKHQLLQSFTCVVFKARGNQTERWQKILLYKIYTPKTFTCVLSIAYVYILPVCRYLAIPSNQDNVTELLLLQVALHLSEGLFCMVNSLVEFLRAARIHVTVGWQGVADSW